MNEDNVAPVHDFIERFAAGVAEMANKVRPFRDSPNEDAAVFQIMSGPKGEKFKADLELTIVSLTDLAETLAKFHADVTTRHVEIVARQQRKAGQ